MSYVRVAKPFRSTETIASFSRAVADIFKHGVLTISTEDGDEWEEFQPDQWKWADVCDEDGYLRYRFVNPDIKQPERMTA